MPLHCDSAKPNQSAEQSIALCEQRTDDIQLLFLFWLFYCWIQPALSILDKYSLKPDPVLFFLNTHIIVFPESGFIYVRLLALSSGILFSGMYICFP
jgi:hypothetical protein